MAWCFTTRASATTVLTMHPCVSQCLGVKYFLGCIFFRQTPFYSCLLRHMIYPENISWLFTEILLFFLIRPSPYHPSFNKLFTFGSFELYKRPLVYWSWSKHQRKLLSLYALSLSVIFTRTNYSAKHAWPCYKKISSWWWRHDMDRFFTLLALSSLVQNQSW